MQNPNILPVTFVIVEFRLYSFVSYKYIIAWVFLHVIKIFWWTHNENTGMSHNVIILLGNI